MQRGRAAVGRGGGAAAARAVGCGARMAVREHGCSGTRRTCQRGLHAAAEARCLPQRPVVSHHAAASTCRGLHAAHGCAPPHTPDVRNEQDLRAVLQHQGPQVRRGGQQVHPAARAARGVHLRAKRQPNPILWGRAGACEQACMRAAHAAACGLCVRPRTLWGNEPNLLSKRAHASTCTAFMLLMFSYTTTRSPSRMPPPSALEHGSIVCFWWGEHSSRPTGTAAVCLCGGTVQQAEMLVRPFGTRAP